MTRERFIQVGEAEPEEPEYYTIKVHCGNCDYTGDMEIQKGVPVGKAACEYCGCNDLIRDSPVQSPGGAASPVTRESQQEALERFQRLLEEAERRELDRELERELEREEVARRQQRRQSIPFQPLGTPYTPGDGDNHWRHHVWNPSQGWQHDQHYTNAHAVQNSSVNDPAVRRAISMANARAGEARNDAIDALACAAAAMSAASTGQAASPQ